jgi:anti-sigma B factor antagonist
MSVTAQRLDENIYLVRSQGRLDQSLNPALESCLVELLDQGHRRLIIDLTEVTYINSGGLRCLVSAWRQSRSQGGDLVIFGLNKRLEEIFSLIGFDRVFTIYSTVEDAQRHNYP